MLSQTKQLLPKNVYTQYSIEAVNYIPRERKKKKNNPDAHIATTIYVKRAPQQSSRDEGKGRKKKKNINHISRTRHRNNDTI